MKPPSCWPVLFLVALAAPLAAQAPGQRASPRAGYAYPAGGRQGTTVQVAIGGQNLAGASAVHFSHPLLHAKVLGYERPISQQEFNNVREKLQELLARRAAAQKAKASGAADQPAWTPADDALVAELRLKVANPPNRQASPAIAETVTLEVTIPADTPPGEHELRVKAAGGLSNPLVFCVSQLPEFTDARVLPTTPPAEAGRTTAAAAVRSKPPRSITLPTIVNGQVLPGEVDRFKFTGAKGQKLTIAVSARALIPYLADAVPGWFQPTLALFDAKGRELAYADDYRFNPDPVVLYQLPGDGDYVLEIKDAIFRGREDFVYRIAVGELPFVTSMFPLGAGAAPQTTFELAGWNLPKPQLEIDTAGRAPGVFLLSVRNEGQLSNPVRFAVDAEPAIDEREPNDDPAHAQPIAAAQIVNGRIGRRGDQDVFRFEGRAGDTIVAEIVARRLQSPLDSVLEVTDAAGRRLALNDDCEDKRSGRDTHHADSRAAVTLPADGAYHVRVAEAQRQGGDEFGYRLRVGPARPDFELRVVPSTLNARAGAHVALTVHALRRDGFSGEIILGLKDPPPGFALSGGRIPAGQDKVTLTLATPPQPREEPFTLVLGGRAVIGGAAVTHLAVPADDMEQAFFYHHLVPMREWKVQLVNRGGAARLAARATLQLPVDGRARFQAIVPGVRNARRVRAELAGAPEGLAVAGASLTGDTVEIIVTCDGARAQLPLAGNLIVHVFAEREGGPAGTPKRLQRAYVATLPAVPFAVVPAGTGVRADAEPAPGKITAAASRRP